jgi:hypothetical protein
MYLATASACYDSSIIINMCTKPSIAPVGLVLFSLRSWSGFIGVGVRKQRS